MQYLADFALQEQAEDDLMHTFSLQNLRLQKKNNSMPKGYWSEHFMQSSKACHLRVGKIKLQKNGEMLAKMISTDQ